MEKITIAIDGFSGTGKGTTAKGVAHHLGYTYLDTGAMWRAASLYALENNLIHSTGQEKVSMIKNIDISFEYIHGKQHTFLNGKDVEDQIRMTSLALQMKPIVSCIPLRKEMIALMQAYGSHGGIVCDGRDAGTHIFPDAQLKVFMICNVDTRIRRRVSQLQESGLPVDTKKIKEEIEMRDQTDYLGPDAVNSKATDAKELDTTHMTIDQQIQKVVSRAEVHIGHK